MRGENPAFLNKFDEDQAKWLITGPGKMFLDDFLRVPGDHCFCFGTTGSGKTNRGLWLLSYLRFFETQIWMDSGKSGEILPLFCFDMPVNVIVPKYTDVIFEENTDGKWEEFEPESITYVPDAGTAWWAVKKDYINIFCFRNAFWTVGARAAWMTELFKTLADWTRLHRMPRIFPFSLHIDESQWVLAGTRISRDEDRVKSSGIITENALEIRSSGGRLIMYAQDFMNIPPAVRQNLVCAILCRGAAVKPEQDRKLSRHCNPPLWEKQPANYRKWEGKFVTEDGRSSPTNRPWVFPLMPKFEEDREWVKRCRVRYDGFNDQRPTEAETEEECFPELGRFSALAIKPEVSPVVESRWNVPDGGIEDD